VLLLEQGEMMGTFLVGITIGFLLGARVFYKPWLREAFRLSEQERDYWLNRYKELSVRHDAMIDSGDSWKE
jgi:hypothetical protein